MASVMRHWAAAVRFESGSCGHFWSFLNGRWAARVEEEAAEGRARPWTGFARGRGAFTDMSPM